MEEIFTIVLLAATLVQLIYLLLFARLAYYRSPQFSNPPSTEGVSVVICAHNELHNLQTLIPLITNQQHPLFEIILVNDRSTDGTSEWANTLTLKNLSVLHIEHTETGWSPKKYALQKGIEQARYPHLLLTDADCKPNSANWIQKMTYRLGVNTDACIGYSPYNKEPGFLNLLIRFETAHTATQYMSFALAGMPYMGVGRNIAYTKALFEQHQGLHRIKGILGGDDDLFSNQAFRSKRVAIEISEDSFVYSVPKRSYAEWFTQKIRHLDSGRRYKLSTRIAIAILMFSQTFFYASFLPVLYFQNHLVLSFICLFFRTLLLIYIFVRITCNFKEKIAWYWIPILDFCYTFNYIFIGLNTYFFNRNQWK